MENKQTLGKNYLSALILLFLTIAIIIPSAGWGSERLSVNGYLKNFSVAYDYPGVKGLPDSLDQPIIGSVSNRTRINGHFSLSRRVSFSISYDFAPRIQDRDLFNDQFGLIKTSPGGYRVDDLNNRLYPSEEDSIRNFAIFQSLDRAVLTINTDFADMYIGRQAIAWGSSRVVNPTDIVVPYSYDALNTEDRIGADAVRIRVPIGFMGELDAGWLAGEDFKHINSAVYIRGKYYISRMDISLILLDFRENLLVGCDVARAIGGAGFWLETAYVLDDELNKNDSLDNDYFRGTAGLDYSFGGKMYGFFEYHYNQAGSNDPDDYKMILSQTAYTDGNVFLLGEHYLIPGLTFQLTPLLTFSGRSIWNLSDLSVLITPIIEYYIAENIYLSAGGYIGFGKRPELIVHLPQIPDIDFKSEFGGYADTYFTSFRVYF